MNRLTIFYRQSGKKYAPHLNYFYTKSSNYQHQSQQTKKSKITTANSIIRNSSMKRFKQTDWSVRYLYLSIINTLI